MPWIHVEDTQMAPPPLELIVRAPEVVDAINRLIEELMASRVSVTKGLASMSAEMDNLVSIAHETLDTEQAASAALAELFRLWQDAQSDPPKAAALAAELQARRAELAAAIANTDPTATTTTAAPTTTAEPTTTEQPPTTLA